MKRARTEPREVEVDVNDCVKKALAKTREGLAKKGRAAGHEVARIAKRGCAETRVVEGIKKGGRTKPHEAEGFVKKAGTKPHETEGFVKKAGTKPREVRGFGHHCDWRKASILLAQCVVATLQTDGKIGLGTGLVMKVVDGKRIVERWDKDFIEALAFIGIEMTERKKKSRPAKFPGVVSMSSGTRAV